MYRILFSFLLGLTVIIMSSLPLTVHADGRKDRDRDNRQGGVTGKQKVGIVERQGVVRPGRIDRDKKLDRDRDNAVIGRYGSYYYGTYGYPSTTYYGTYGYPNSIYGSYYGTGYSYPSSSYSTYPLYPNTYAYPGYRTYYYNPGMYNPNTTFVNPPSSLNSPTGYPTYSETYIYR